jgi:hypothetical protein
VDVIRRQLLIKAASTVKRGQTWYAPLRAGLAALHAASRPCANEFMLASEQNCDESKLAHPACTFMTVYFLQDDTLRPVSPPFPAHLLPKRTCGVQNCKPSRAGSLDSPGVSAIVNKARVTRGSLVASRQHSGNSKCRKQPQVAQDHTGRASALAQSAAEQSPDTSTRPPRPPTRLSSISECKGAGREAQYDSSRAVVVLQPWLHHASLQASAPPQH